MASDPIGTISGLSSGIQWRDMIDQIMQLESSRQLSPLTSAISAANARIDAWNKFQGVAQKLADALAPLKDGSAFDAFNASAAASPTSGRTLLSASAAAGAAPGSYQVEVAHLASAEKLSGVPQGDASTPLGITGAFAVNGATIQVSPTDTLSTLRDRINTANAGTAPTRVSAAILTTGGTSRLVLTSDVTGASGIELTDDATGTLGALGFVDESAKVANVTASGAARSNRFNVVTSTIASMLGVTLPPPTTIKVGGRTVTVDLTQDSLAGIAAKINAAGGSARTVSESVGGQERWRLVVDDAVAADPADPANSQRALDVLGFQQAGRGALAQTLVTGAQLQDGSGNAASAATTLDALVVNGAAAGAKAGDTIAIRGTRGDGTAVSLDYTIASGDTVGTLVDRLNAAFAGTRGAAATLGADGRIVLTDSTGGDSQLALSLASDNAGGGQLAFGGVSTTQVGRAREIVAGSDATIRVDGVLVQRTANTIGDAIAGVTLDLQQAEAGTQVAVTVSRDDDGIASAIKKLAGAYNDVKSFVDAQTGEGAALAHDGTLRSSFRALTTTLLTDVAGLAPGATMGRPTLAGLSLTKTGTLELDADALKSALDSRFVDVRALFSTGAVSSSGDLSFVVASARVKPGTYTLNVTQPATVADVTGAAFGATYPGGDTIKVHDGYTGKDVSVALTANMTADALAAALRTAFEGSGLHLTAAASAGALRLAGTEYGSAASFTVSYADAAGNSAAAAAGYVGMAAGSYAGTDVAGVFVDSNGASHVATGAGQILTGAADTGGTPVEGLAVRYAGSAMGQVGTVSYALGVAGALDLVVQGITRTGDGTVPSQVASLQATVDAATNRSDDVQSRLDLRRASLLKQYAAMEDAIGRAQAQGTWLTSQITALNASLGSNSGN